MILVIVPTFGRPHKMRPLAENVRAATGMAAETLFVTEADDEASCLEAAGVNGAGLAAWCINSRKRTFAGAFNCGYHVAEVRGIPFTHVFVGADDVWFTEEWDKPALAALARDPALRVAGTNDLHNANVLAGAMATHYLVDRRYIDEVGGVADQPPGMVQCEAYAHNYTDTEFCETARARGVWTPCLEAVVEHCHPVWGRGQWDEGYAKSQGGMGADSVIFATRRHLWESQACAL